MTTKTTHSEEQAKAQLASIREMVAALECDYDRLEELRDELLEAFDDQAEQNDPKNTAQFMAWVTDAANSSEMDKSGHPFRHAAIELLELTAACTIGGDKMESQDDARQRIEEHPLSIEVRSGWAAMGQPLEAEEYCILLCTGGPACRIVGDLSSGEPSSARLEHQDWGTPWTEHFEAGAEEVLLKYARCFRFCE